jgi:hypothetical protein
MKKQILILALMTAFAGSVWAATVVAPGTSGDSVNKSLTVRAGTAVKDVETVNGSIDLESKSSADGVETVNGSIDVADDVSVSKLETVNGSIRVGSGLKTTGDVETVNGRIEVGAGSTIQGSVSTVNGRVTLDQVSVSKSAETVNGGLLLRASRIGGNVEMVNGRAEVLDGTIVGGDIIVRKPKGNWGWGGKSKAPVVVIGPGSEVRGQIRIENDATKLYISDSARVGSVEGVKAISYSGAEAPE